MRRVIMSALLALFIQSNVDARILVNENRMTKGECGYMRVLESHDRGVDALSCHDPGYCDCRFSEPITQTPKNIKPIEEVNSTLNTIDAVIDHETANGIMNGTFSSELGNVVWSQSEDGNVTIEID
jgi:hypothetical protein